MAFGGILRQSTSVDVLIGPFLDETTGKDVEAGLTIEDEHVLLSKNGQALTAKTDANNAANDGGTAYYNCPLDTTDTNTVGQLTLAVHMAGALPIRLDFQVMDTVPYDEMFKDAAVGMQGVVEVNNLDHLLKVDTGVVVDGDLSGHVITGSVLAHIMASDKDVTTSYNCSTDSLEAIKVHADTIKAETAAIQVETTAIDVLTKAAGAGDLAAILIDTDDLQGNQGAWATATGFATPTNITAGTITTATNVTTVNGLAANTITATSINADAITSAKIADNALANEHFAAGALTSTEITSAAGCVVSSIANDAITAASINTGAIAADAVGATALDNIVMSDLAQGAPSATSSIKTAINWLFNVWRNKTETTATKITVYRDDGAEELATSAIDDDATTFTKAEFVSGT